MRTQSIIVGIGEMIQLVSSLKNSDKFHSSTLKIRRENTILMILTQSAHPNWQKSRNVVEYYNLCKAAFICSIPLEERNLSCYTTLGTGMRREAPP